jgi:FkbM family methyltransferase
MPSFAETSRRVLRRAMPPDAYVALAQRYGALASARSIGWTEYRRLRAVAAADRRAEPVAFQPAALRHPVWLRPGTTDALVFESNLARQAYGCVPAPRAARFIVDAGANVGFASAYFLNRFPDAVVVALEPEPANFALAQRNLEPYGARVALLQQALWYEATTLHLQAAPREDSAAITAEPAAGDVECAGIDPMTLLERAGVARIDILKMDIEGAEVELFSHHPERWLEHTDVLVMEVHGAAAKRVVYDVMARLPFRVAQSRELHVFVRAPVRSGW